MAQQNLARRFVTTSMERWRRASAALLLLIFVSISSPACGSDLIRVWVDWSGQHSIKATLVQVQADTVVLLTPEGKRISIPIEKLSENDRQYVEEFGTSQLNVLRSKAPRPPEVEALPPLDLPPAESTAENNSVLEISRAHTATTPTTLPAAIPADRAPIEIPILEQQFTLRNMRSHDVCSELIPVGTAGQPALGISISAGITNPDDREPVHRLVRLDAHTSKMEVLYRSPDRVRLFDHHPPSDRSLILEGHNSLGQGGKLAIGRGWNRGGMFIRHYRAFPGSEVLGQFPHLRWAKLIDDEHFVAVVDSTLIAANIVSGKVLYRIEDIHGKSVPALSGGRRFMAVPVEGAVHLYRSQDGGALGRIGTESNVIPAVAFSHEADSLAIVNSRRLRIWSLPDAALRADIETRQNLGSGTPTWVDADLLLSGSGVLISIFRGIPVWRYEVAGTKTNYAGGNIAILRRNPNPGAYVLKLPHRGANEAMRWIDAIPAATPSGSWKIPGRSVWSNDGWDDRDVRVSLKSQTIR